jgi:hypothetical protein
MRRIIPLFVLIGLLVSCTRLPDVKPTIQVDVDLSLSDFDRVYPDGRWQLTHSIEATVPGGGKNGLIGVSVLSSKDRTIQCALLTIEGFVLFSGRYDKEIIVDRALPPFDRPGFSEGLMNDLQLLFFKPNGHIIASGTLSNGGRVRRYRLPTGETTDLILDNDRWTIHKYSSGDQIERTAEGQNPIRIGNSDPVFISQNLSLLRHGAMGYRLDMRLVEAIPLDEAKNKVSE